MTKDLLSLDSGNHVVPILLELSVFFGAHSSSVFLSDLLEHVVGILGQSMQWFTQPAPSSSALVSRGRAEGSTLGHVLFHLCNIFHHCI